MNVTFNFYFGCCFRKVVAKPNPVKILAKRKTNMKWELNFQLPTKSASDVVTQELSVAINGVASVVLGNFAADLTETGFIGEFNDNDALSITVVDIDGAGNRSPASEPALYILVDDVAPPQPGMVGVMSKREKV